MRDYIILNGVNSNTITGLLISKLPPITKPKIRTQTEEIDGRDGDIVTKLGYSAYDKELEIGLYGDFDINDVIAYFNSEGTVTFSNEPDKFYNYQILDQIDYEKLIRFKKANVRMHVQPFKYPLEETPVEITNQYVNNEAEEMDLDNTKEALMKIDLKGNTSQEGTPTPEAPQDIHVVSGDNNIEVCGKNLFDKSKDIVEGYTFGNNNTYISASDFFYQSYYIPVKPNTTYSFLGQRTTGTDSLRVCEYKSDKEFIKRNYELYTITTTQNTRYIRVSNYKTKLDTTQVEISSTATTYEAYTGASYDIDLPVENLFSEFSIADRTASGLEIKRNSDNTLLIKGTSTAVVNNWINNLNISLNSGTYTFSTNYDLGSKVTIALKNNNSQNIVQFNSGKSATFSINETTIFNQMLVQVNSGVTIDNSFTFQLEKGSKANSYTPYGTTPIELCKIGDYQDSIVKDNGKWYLNKQVGKVVLNGSENNWSSVAQSGGYNRITFSDYSYLKNFGSSRTTNLYCNNFYVNTTDGYSYIFQYENDLYYYLPNGITTKNEFLQLLSTNNSIVYYALATPTTTEITDETLIAQLEALANATSYDTKTHITQNANDKPFILNATALQQGSGEATVENEGNIYSKPTLDIEGSGTIGIYLEGNQMFSVDLSNANECIIDTAQLEAYNPSTNALMNRQVTGDYSNFKLNAGENQVSTTGEITKVTISNYTRWL